MSFTPDYKNILDAAQNRKPRRLPLYEHIIDPQFMEKLLGKRFAPLISGNIQDIQEFFRIYCNFFKQMTYDTVSFEVCITEILPGHGAIMGGKPGPIQNRRDFENYPWQELPKRFWQIAHQRFSILTESLPEGMSAIGGIGNGVFEISEDLVGYEYLCYMQNDDPELLGQIYKKIGDLMVQIWLDFILKYGRYFCVCRFGDDLGFKTGILPTRQMFSNYILSEYQKVISVIRKEKPFLWHSCGNIFEVMDDIIGLGINAKHSNEDQIAPFEKWIELYSSRIGLFGGIDVDLICSKSPSEVYEAVLEKGATYRKLAGGYAIGSGNSIPSYVPVDGYMAMIKAVQNLRESAV